EGCFRILQQSANHGSQIGSCWAVRKFLGRHRNRRQLAYTLSSSLRELLKASDGSLKLIVSPAPQRMRRYALLDVWRNASAFEVRALPREVCGARQRDAVAVPHLECACRDQPPRGLCTYECREAVLRRKAGDHFGRAGRMLVYQHHYVSVMALRSQRFREDSDRPPLQRKPKHQ